MPTRVTYRAVECPQDGWAVERVMASDMPGLAPSRSLAYGPPLYPPMRESWARRLAERLDRLHRRRG